MNSTGPITPMCMEDLFGVNKKVAGLKMAGLIYFGRTMVGVGRGVGDTP